MDGRRHLRKRLRFARSLSHYTREFLSSCQPCGGKGAEPVWVCWCSAEPASGWHQVQRETSDFYLTGVHRGDDAFALMEQHAIKEQKIERIRNIDHFAYLRRYTEKPQKEEFHFPVAARASSFRRPSLV